MIEPLRLIVASLGVYRVAHMLAREDGPFDVFLIWRDSLTGRYGKDHWLSKGFSCVLCLSFWGSLVGMVWAVWCRWLLLDFLAGWLAVAGLVLVFHQFAESVEKIVALIMQGR